MQPIQTFLSYLAPGWVGSVIGITSLIAAGIIYVFTRQRTSVSFAYCGDRLLGSSTVALPAEISVHYKGMDIPRLTRSIIIIWNSGEKTIVKEDIVKADPLRVSICDDGQILSVAFLKTSRLVNQAAIARAGDQAELTFDFLDAGDGVVIEILHTSESSQPAVHGTIRGLPKGVKYIGRVTRSNPLKKRIAFMPPSVFLWSVTIAGLILMLVGILVSAETLETFMTSTPAPGWIMVVFFGFIHLCGGLYLLYVLRRKHPRALHTEELE